MSTRVVTDQYMTQKRFCTGSQEAINTYLPPGAELTHEIASKVADACWKLDGFSDKVKWCICAGVRCLQRADAPGRAKRECALQVGISDLPERLLTNTHIYHRALACEDPEYVAVEYLLVCFMYENDKLQSPE